VYKYRLHFYITASNTVIVGDSNRHVYKVFKYFAFFKYIIKDGKQPISA